VVSCRHLPGHIRRFVVPLLGNRIDNN
jgi:hypothetical protein